MNFLNFFIFLNCWIFVNFWLLNFNSSRVWISFNASFSIVLNKLRSKTRHRMQFKCLKANPDTFSIVFSAKLSKIKLDKPRKMPAEFNSNKLFWLKISVSNFKSELNEPFSMIILSRNELVSIKKHYLNGLRKLIEFKFWVF